MIRELQNKIKHMERKITKNQAKWVDVFQSLGGTTKEDQCSKYKHKLYNLCVAQIKMYTIQKAGFHTNLK